MTSRCLVVIRANGCRGRACFLLAQLTLPVIGGCHVKPTYFNLKFTSVCMKFRMVIGHELEHLSKMTPLYKHISCSVISLLTFIRVHIHSSCPSIK